MAYRDLKLYIALACSAGFAATLFHSCKAEDANKAALVAPTTDAPAAP